MLGQIKQLSASGYVVGANDNTKIKAITLQGGSDTATLTLKEGGSGGTERLEIKAAAGTIEHLYFGEQGFMCPGAYAALSGTGPKVSFVLV